MSSGSVGSTSSGITSPSAQESSSVAGPSSNPSKRKHAPSAVHRVKKSQQTTACGMQGEAQAKPKRPQSRGHAAMPTSINEVIQLPTSPGTTYKIQPTLSTSAEEQFICSTTVDPFSMFPTTIPHNGVSDWEDRNELSPLHTYQEVTHHTETLQAELNGLTQCLQEERLGKQNGLANIPVDTTLHDNDAQWRSLELVPESRKFQ